MIGWLRDARVDEVILAANHLSDRLRQEVEGGRSGSKVRLSVEERPLGTAGPVRLARDFLENEERFVVVNGDIVSDIGLSDMMKFHAEKDAAITVALVSVPDPKPYGSVTITEGNKITEFHEKTDTGSKSTLINAGVYVVNSDIIATIPSGRPVSMERDIFPALAKNGSLRGWKHSGYWYDIGRISEYVKANRQLLLRTRKVSAVRGSPNGNVREPCFVGEGASIDSGSSLGPYAILSDRVVVKGGSVVSDSIVFEETVIEEGCRVEGALVGERVIVGRDTRIGNGAVVAGEIAIPKGSVIRQNSIVLT